MSSSPDQTAPQSMSLSNYVMDYDHDSSQTIYVRIAHVCVIQYSQTQHPEIN